MRSTSAGDALQIGIGIINPKGITKLVVDRSSLEATMKYVVKHAKCDLYIAERAGSMARWGEREEAISKTKEEWEAELSPSLNRDLIEFEAVSS